MFLSGLPQISPMPSLNATLIFLLAQSAALLFASSPVLHAQSALISAACPLPGVPCATQVAHATYEMHAAGWPSLL